MMNTTSWVQQVQGLYADLYGYHEEHFCFRYVNYQVLCEYQNPTMFELVVRRVDTMAGWADNLQVLVWNHTTTDPTATVIQVGPSMEHEIRIPISVGSESPLLPQETWTMLIPITHPYSPTRSFQRIDRTSFNRRFHSDIHGLPSSLFAVGIDQENSIYVYNETYQTYDDISAPIQHLVDVALTYKLTPLYFVISSQDGYFENTYHETSRNDVPIYHRGKYILCQSSHTSFPYTWNVVDRHYFYHNLYNSFRSFHRGIPFEQKQSMLVFGAQDRGTHRNFLVNRSIELSPRMYFKKHIAPRYPWILCSDEDTWIDRKDMIHYKYILDVDGIASTWDATAWKLNSGSVIFKSQSPWQQWFYPQYLPDVHFIEIKDDFSDIEEKFRWCEAHPDKCLAMVQRCLQLFQEVYRYDHICQHSRHLLQHCKENLQIRSIDRVFYINLDQRQDRKTHIESQLHTCGFASLMERFPGIVHEYDQAGEQRAQRFVHQGWYNNVTHSKGIIGCTKSHLEIYRMAKQRSYQYVMILEDDFQLLVSKEEFHNAIEQLFLDPTFSFDVCMLSYKLIQGTPVPGKPFLTRVREAQTASGYIVHASYLDTLIQLYETTLPLLEHTGEHWLYANDQAWKVLQSSDRWYCFTTRLGKQMDGYSDNAGTYMNYTF